MATDGDLLQRYLGAGDESAFAEVVRCHLPHVYAAALRQTRDRGLAEDVAQKVFQDLARKARTLPADVVLAAWLHRATRFAARDAVRGWMRRIQREQTAFLMKAGQQQHPEPPWEEIQEWLDMSLDALPAGDREAICLRYLEQRSLSEVGVALGTTADTARKRVDRALERLRELLAQRGVHTTAAALGSAVMAQAAPPVPPALVASVLVSTVNQPAWALSVFMVSTPIKSTAALILVALLVALPLLHQERAIAEAQAQRPRLALTTQGGLEGTIQPTAPVDHSSEMRQLETDIAELRRRWESLAAEIKEARGSATSGTRLHGDQTPIAALEDAGQSSPANVFQTYLAAMRSGDTNRLTETWCLPEGIRPQLLQAYLRAAEPAATRGFAAELRSGVIADLIVHREEPADLGDQWVVYQLLLADGTAGPPYRIRARLKEDRWRIVLKRTGEPDQEPVPNP